MSDKELVPKFLQELNVTELFELLTFIKDIRKDERGKTIDEAIEFLKADPCCLDVTFNAFKDEFLLLNSAEELTK